METRVALVTGAAKGLGRGIAIDLARCGYELAIVHRPQGSTADAVCARIRAEGREPLAIAEDVGVAGSGERIVGAVHERFGRLDVVVHAAGPIVVRRFERCTIADYHAMLSANLTSSVELALAALPRMRERKFGRIVYFGMNGSHATQPAVGMSLYGAAKAGVVTFARALALEEARRGITVNIIEPGDIRDKERGRAAAASVPADNPTGHAGSWEDIAYAVRFLVADDAGFVNGQTIGVNGGLVGSHE